MNDLEEFQKGLQYSDDVNYAVRYGYLYRKEAIKYYNGHAHACLGDSSEILLFLANMIVGGVAWDLIKIASKKLYKQLSDLKVKIDKDSNLLFSDEDELKLFFNCVREFNNGCMDVTEKQLNYIREEIRADYCGKETQKIFTQYRRLPTIEEYMRINGEAEAHADRIMKLKQ